MSVTNNLYIPKMGSHQTDTVRIQDALFSRVQQRVLGILFGQPDRRFQGAELIRMANSGTGAVHRQLTSLAASELVNVTQVGNQKHYQANPDSPVFEELCSLIRKTGSQTRKQRVDKISGGRWASVY